MDFETAVNRIVWRFQECERITVNEKDITAINKIVNYINQSMSQNIQNNLHFSKLYTYTLGKFLAKYETSIDNPLAHKELHRLLERPLGHFIQELTTQLNFQCQYSFLEASGLKSDLHPISITPKERNSILSNLEGLLVSSTNRQLFFGEAWNVDEVETNISKQINNFLYGI